MPDLLPNKKLNLVRHWENGSKSDFEAAQEIFENTKRFTSALFYGHLSVEKKLKAAFVSKFGTHAPYTHNLIHLVSKLEWEIDNETELKLREINEFNMDGRYPDEKNSFEKKATKIYCQAQLKKIEEVLDWISQK
jgi:HEPN domain-containing protein